MSGSTRPVRRHQIIDGRARATELVDAIAEEWPVAICFNGMPHAVMLATPQDLEAFALGFALSEGLLASHDECLGIEITRDVQSCRAAIRVTDATLLRIRMKRQRRTLAGASGCGLCGVESLDMLDLDLPVVTPHPALARVTPAAVLQAVAALPARQVLNSLNGATHAAAWVTPAGEILEVGEDVGRHNALDKMIGQRALAAGFDAGFVLMSSRASFELVSKCARLNIGMLVAISAPTTLAIDIAQRSGLRLMGWARNDQLVEYTVLPAAT
jgi:FdhD protein